MGGKRGGIFFFFVMVVVDQGCQYKAQVKCLEVGLYKLTIPEDTIGFSEK